MNSWTAYLCPEPWQPTGIVHPEVLAPDLRVEVRPDGAVEAEAFLCPLGYDCTGMEVTAYILPKGRGPIDCLLCYEAGEDFFLRPGVQEKVEDLLQKHNQARHSFPEECTDPCPGLELDWIMCRCAMDYAFYCLLHECYEHVCDGKQPWERLMAYGVVFNAWGENVAMVEDDDLEWEEAIERAFAGWMNSEGHRKNIMNNAFTRAGFGYARKDWVYGSPPRRRMRYVFVAEFADEDVQLSASIPKPDFPCNFECVKLLRWEQDYDEYWDNVGGTWVKRRSPKPYLKIPCPTVQICAFERMVLWGSETGKIAEWQFGGKGECSNALEYVFDEEYMLTLPFSACTPFPGEQLLLYGYLRGYEGDPCNPIIIAYGWFETHCYTSARITAIKTDIGIIYSGSLPDAWVGDESLRYVVEYKGEEYELKPSDFHRYSVGDTVLVHKDGLADFYTVGGEKKKRPACRGPVFGDDPGYMPTEEERLLSYTNVTYELDPDSDVIVPVDFCGG